MDYQAVAAAMANEREAAFKEDLMNKINTLVTKVQELEKQIEKLVSAKKTKE